MRDRTLNIHPFSRIITVVETPSLLARIRLWSPKRSTRIHMRFIALFVGGCITCLASPDPKIIIDRYRAAHDSRDLKAMLSLIEFTPDTPADVVAFSKARVEQEFGLKIIDIKVKPLEESDRRTLGELGKVVDPTLAPVAKFVVTWDLKSQSAQGKATAETSFLGVKDGEYRFVSAMRKPHQAAPAQHP